MIDITGSRWVLILGRFTPPRKLLFEALREELRKLNYSPVLFEFGASASRDITETVSMLGRMARFIVADLTDASSIPRELTAIVPIVEVPIQPLIENSSASTLTSFSDLWRYDWVLPVVRYEGLDSLLTNIAEKVIAPAEAKLRALRIARDNRLYPASKISS